MAMNKNWPRWIFASVSKFFIDKMAIENLPMFIEGQHRDLDPTLQDYCELRIDGPNTTEVARNQWHLYMEVNVLISSIMNDSDYHRIHTSAGVVGNAFECSIPVYKYGNTVDDDDSLIGCLSLQQDRKKRERIQISHFGQVAPNTKLLQASVEGHFIINLEV